MQTQRTRRGGGTTKDATAQSVAIARPATVWLFLLSIALFAAGGCVQAEKARYVRHLTTVVEPSAGVPEEAILTFDIDRKKLPQGAVAVGIEN